MFLLIDNYDSFTYNLYALFIKNGCRVEVVKNSKKIKNNKYEGIILSPGPSIPENSGATLDYLEKFFGKIPFFGVCLGMQAICHHMGYTIRRSRSIRHGKKENIIRQKVKPLAGGKGRYQQKDSVVLEGLPEKFVSVRYHSLAVECDEQIITSYAEYDGECMSIEDRVNNVFGVQFHPESYFSEFGFEIVKNFVRYCKKRK